MKNGDVCSLRGLYYQHCRLFQNQEQSSRLLSRLLAHGNLGTREECHVFPAPKGSVRCLNGTICAIDRDLVHGDYFEIIDRQRESCPSDSHSGPGYHSDDPSDSSAESDSRNSYTVLVVEKQSIFLRLSEDLPSSILRNTILVTGRGYPDVASLDFLENLLAFLAEPGRPAREGVDVGGEPSTLKACYFLGDFDIHGLRIYETYRRRLTQCRFLGLDYTDVARVPDTQMLPITINDRQCLKAFLDRASDDKTDVSATRVRKTALAIQQSEIKCEIEALDAIAASFLTQVYVPHKLAAVREDLPLLPSPL